MAPIMRWASKAAWYIHVFGSEYQKESEGKEHGFIGEHRMTQVPGARSNQQNQSGPLTLNRDLSLSNNPPFFLSKKPKMSVASGIPNNGK